MKTKSQKQAMLAQLKGSFTECPAVVVCKFEGLNVAQDQVLRSELRDLGAKYQVVSNRLAALAAKDTPFESALAGQRGMTALAFPGDDLVGALKALVNYAKQEDRFSFTAGVVEGLELDAVGLDALSKMPGKEGIHAQLLYLINSSTQRLLATLSAPGRDVAAVLQQAVEKNKFNE